MRWRRSPSVLWRTAPGYLAVAAVDGRSVEVDGPGADVWLLVAEWVAEADVSAELAQRYGVEQQVVSDDVRLLLQKLHAQGYVELEE
jgi:hypothetical protein